MTRLDKLESERKLAVAALRDFCKKFGDNDWPDDLPLADVINYHVSWCQSYHAEHSAPRRPYLRRSELPPDEEPLTPGHRIGCACTECVEARLEAAG